MSARRRKLPPPANPTLTEQLRALGLSRRPCPHAAVSGKYEILENENGRVIFTGTAFQTWEWLRREGRIQ